MRYTNNMHKHQSWRIIIIIGNSHLGPCILIHLVDRDSHWVYLAVHDIHNLLLCDYTQRSFTTHTITYWQHRMGIGLYIHNNYVCQKGEIINFQLCFLVYSCNLWGVAIRTIYKTALETIPYHCKLALFLDLAHT